MIRFFFPLLLVLSLINQAKAENKTKIISKFEKINNMSFEFKQNINGKIEEGKCIIEYPKKIYCKYDTSNNKILVSNGKSIVIQTDIGSYYRYSIENTPLNIILNKNLILDKIKLLDEKIFNKKLFKFTLKEDDLIIDVFFNKSTFDITGWRTIDIYQNTSFTTLKNIIINQVIEPSTFNLPKFN